MKKKYSSDERISTSKIKGVFALVLLLFGFQVVIFIFHKCSSQKPDIQAPPKEAELFDFDPNTITSDSLQLLGLSDKQALTIIHYREKGGRFKKKEDLKKIYSVSEDFYSKVERCIEIKPVNQVATNKVKSSTAINRQRPNPVVATASKNHQSAPKVFIDLNEADSAALVSVKGIGPYFARKILEYRYKLGSYARVEQLTEIPHLTPEKLEFLKPQLFIHPAGIRKFALSLENYELLKKHPYIGAYAARGIKLYLESKGAATCSLKELTDNNLIPPEQASKLAPYVTTPQ